MKYLLELHKFGEIFDPNNNIDDIIKKLSSSGYISTITKNKIDEITGIDGSVENLLLQSEKIVDFYNKYSQDFF